MLKMLFVAPLAALLFASSAHASELRTLTLQQPTVSERGLNDIVEVNAHRNPAATIATDALYGGIAGLAIGAGVALIDGSNNWGRNLAIGAGAGLLVGAVFGAIDAASSDRVYTPVGETHDTGFNSAYHYGQKF